MKTIKTANEYIAQYPKEVQKPLKQMRAVIKKAVPKAEESISYGMVGYKFDGKPLIYFGGWKTHVGIYGTPNANKAFAKDLAPYKHGRGSIQFSLNKPIPTALINKIIKHRLAEIKKK